VNPPSTHIGIGTANGALRPEGSKALDVHARDVRGRHTGRPVKLGISANVSGVRDHAASNLLQRPQNVNAQIPSGTRKVVDGSSAAQTCNTDVVQKFFAPRRRNRRVSIFGNQAVTVLRLMTGGLDEDPWIYCRMRSV
jgi:hypothetical protein